MQADAGPTDYDAAVASCASSSAGQPRTQCCQEALPGGWETLVLAQSHCLCGSGGPCATACNYSECAQAQGSTPACQSCVETNVAGSCASAINAECNASASCAAYQRCIAQ